MKDFKRPKEERGGGQKIRKVPEEKKEKRGSELALEGVDE